MSLRNIDLKNEYRSKIDNVVRDFYIPVLKESIKYQRAVGYFSSSALVTLSSGICSLVQNGGNIEIIASPYLQSQDIEAIKDGLKRKDDVLKEALFRELKEAKGKFEQARLNLLSNLIAAGKLNIKIAFMESNDTIGMFHEKLGLMYDSDNNVIAFSGSMNESVNAFYSNYEAIDVFTSWSKDNERVLNKKAAFNAMWGNYEPNIKVIEFPEIADEIIQRYKINDQIDLSIDNEQFPETKSFIKQLSVPNIPEEIEIRDYQTNAMEEWKKRNYRGIFDMATGTGKTYTALVSISEISNDLHYDLALFIVCPYQHLVDQWVEDILKFGMTPIIGYSSSPQKNWKDRLSKAIRDQRIRDDKTFFCFVCTNATFSSSFVQEQINKIKKPILIVVDEAHNVGAESYSKLLDDRFTYRLALSATLERHNDEEGTAELYRFFGEKCIEYTLEQAIQDGKLTPYKYYPIVVYLNEDELAKYEQLSYEMSKCLIKDKNGKFKLNKHGEILALKRARIVAGASEKLDALREHMKPYVKDNNILVYCGATNVLNENSDLTTTDENDIRQIDAVTQILGNELGMAVAQFTSREDAETRANIKLQFSSGKGLQAIVAIKCLDEGVNIPGIKTAFILASTTNPKEYIQRRGRVLRLADNKPFAVIYDFVTLPRPLDTVSSLTAEQAQRDISLVKNEIARLKEFGRLALNSMDSQSLIWEIQDTYNILNTEDQEDYY